MTSSNLIIHYDFNNINYSGYFLTGLYENTKPFSYKFIVSKKIPALLIKEEMQGRWRRILFSICLFKARIDNEEFFFCIDTRDSCEAGESLGDGYHLPLLKEVKYYFKVNYNIDSIKSSPELSKYASKIIPVPLFFAIKPPKLITLRPKIIPNKAVAWSLKDTKLRFSTLRNMVTIDEIRKMRDLEKEFDVFFVVTYYHDKIHSDDNEFRYQIMKEVHRTKNINSLVGFVSNQKIQNYNHAEFQLKPYLLKKYLNCLARSRVAIYVRGLHECLSFKFGQLLSLGLPIIGQTIHNNKDNLLKYKYFNEQFAYDDPKEIAQNVINLLKDNNKQALIGASNAAVFDAKLTPKAITAQILHKIGLKEE